MYIRFYWVSLILSNYTLIGLLTGVIKLAIQSDTPVFFILGTLNT